MYGIDASRDKSCDFEFIFTHFMTDTDYKIFANY
jgi:hypothetical protein